MARDLKPLLRPLAALAEPGLGPVDPRLLSITDLAERRAFADAADRAEELLAEGIYDIRPISILLFEAFIEGGFGALAEVFAVVDLLLGGNKPAVGPSRRQDDHFNRRLVWLFDAVVDALKYHRLKRTHEWGRWQAALEPGAVRAAIERGRALVQHLGADAFKGAHASLARLLDALRREAESLEAAPAPPPPSVEAPAAAPAHAAPAAGAPQAPAEPLEPVRRRVELVVSHSFIELTAKLRAFETLVEAGELEKAALVSDDILSTLDNFDPRAYFPELLGRFSALLSRNIDVLSNHWSMRETPAWKARAQLYRVDLKSFVEG